jgi:hypothetical protein
LFEKRWRGGDKGNNKMKDKKKGGGVKDEDRKEVVPNRLFCWLY